MTFSQLTSNIRAGVKENSSIILSVAAGVGTISTAILAANAGYKAAEVLVPIEWKEGTHSNPRQRFMERAKVVWKLYIPCGISAGATIACIAAVKRVDAKKTLAAQTALAVTQHAYHEYREKVIEELGEKKDQKLLAKVAEDRVNNNPPPATLVIGTGEVLCCELHTGRYFKSDMQALHKAVNDINAKLNQHDYATLDDFYYLIGLAMTSTSGQMGWQSGRHLELEYSSVLWQEKPCLAFDYNYIKSF